MISTLVRARLLRHPAIRLLNFLCLLTIGAAGLTALLYLLRFPPQRSQGQLQPWPLLATGFLACGLVLTVTAMCLRLLERRTLATVGLPRQPFLSTFIVGLGLGAIVPGLTALVLGLFGFASIVPAELSSRLVLTTTLPMLVGTILLAAWEELAFRGYPLQQLIAWTGPWGGAIATGLLFALAHGANPGANILGFLNTATNGTLLAWVVMRTGSLWLACGYHAGWNLMAGEILGLVDSGVRTPGSILGTQLTGPTWLSGGAYGFEASAVTGMLEVVVLGLMLWQARRLPTVSEAVPYFTRAPTAFT